MIFLTNDGFDGRFVVGGISSVNIELDFHLPERLGVRADPTRKGYRLGVLIGGIEALISNLSPCRGCAEVETACIIQFREHTSIHPVVDLEWIQCSDYVRFLTLQRGSPENAK